MILDNIPGFASKSVVSHPDRSPFNRRMFIETLISVLILVIAALARSLRHLFTIPVKKRRAAVLNAMDTLNAIAALAMNSK